MEDKLEIARRSRSKPYPDQEKFPGKTIGGSVLNLSKWTMDSTLQYAELLITAVKLLSPTARPKAMEDLMKQDLKVILKQYKTEVDNILAGTVLVNNFETIEQSLEWVKILGNDDYLALLVEIGRRNLVPLAEALGIKNIVLPPEIQAILGQSVSA